MRVAVIGTGYWGIHHVRVFAALPGAELTWVCDVDEGARVRARKLAPEARCATSADDVLAADDVDAVVIATPARSHAALACRAIAAGKHVLVEKPLALSVADADRIRAAALASQVTVMVGHLMVYNPAVVALRELMMAGELGELFYLYARRVNLGRLRTDESALWSFGPHDLSMIDFLLGQRPVSVTARGESYLQPGVEDVVFVTLRFASGQMAHVHLSWLDPRKERRLTVVGDRKMAELDDMAQEKLRVFDRGYDRPPAFSGFGDYLTLRHGAVTAPAIASTEPLVAEAQHFVACAETGAVPITDLDSATRIIDTLAAAEASLAADGAPIRLARARKAA